jgi:hypothetical protein
MATSCCGLGPWTGAGFGSHTHVGHRMSQRSLGAFEHRLLVDLGGSAFRTRWALGAGGQYTCAPEWQSPATRRVMFLPCAALAGQEASPSRLHVSWP